MDRDSPLEEEGFRENRKGEEGKGDKQGATIQTAVSKASTQANSESSANLSSTLAWPVLNWFLKYYYFGGPFY